MDIVIVPADGCLYDCPVCPYSSKKPKKTSTPPHEVPEGLLVFCPGAISFPQLFAKVVSLADMSDFAVLMAPVREEPPEFEALSKFDIIFAVAPSLSYIDYHRDEIERRLEAAPAVRIAIPFDPNKIEEALEVERIAMIAPPLSPEPTIEKLKEIEGLKLSQRSFSRYSVGARRIQVGVMNRRTIVFFMPSNELYDKPFKLVTPNGTKITTFSRLFKKNIEPIVHVDLKLPNGTIVPDKLLRILDLIDNKKNLTRVAEILNTTYQNISQTVRRFEQQLGVKLIHSTPGKGGGARLTEEGKKLVAIRRDIIANVETRVFLMEPGPGFEPGTSGLPLPRSTD